jgi:hypothetical protein
LKPPHGRLTPLLHFDPVVEVPDIDNPIFADYQETKPAGSHEFFYTPIRGANVITPSYE